MKSSSDRDGSSEKRMKSSDILVYSDTARDDLEKWKKAMKAFFKQLYGSLVECLTTGTASRWMDPDAEFEWKETDGSPRRIPEKSDVIKFSRFKKSMEEFEDYQSDWKRYKTTLTEILYNGCISDTSRTRLNEFDRVKTNKIRDEGDFLGLYQLILESHTFKGYLTTDQDQGCIRKLLQEWTQSRRYLT